MHTACLLTWADSSPKRPNIAECSLRALHTAQNVTGVGRERISDMLMNHRLTMESLACLVWMCVHFKLGNIFC